MISLAYGLRSLMTQSQIAQITNVPATPPVTPSPTPGINIQTPSVSLRATNLQVLMGSQTMRSYYELPSFIAPYSTNSVTDPNHTTLEAYWEEGANTFHIYLYFEAYNQYGGGRYWRFLNAKTLYNNTTWLDMNSTSPELIEMRPIGTSLYLPFVEFTTINNDLFTMRLTDLNLNAFINEIPASPTPSPYPSPSIITLCNYQPPKVVITPNNQSGTPGQTLTYNVAITNMDSHACNPSNFGFGTMVESPFSASPSVISNYIPAGGTFHTTFTVTSPSTNPWNEQRSIPVSFASTNFASNLNSSSTAGYTLTMPSPQTFNMYFKLAGVNGGSADGAKITIKFYLKNGKVMSLSEPLTLSYGSDGVYKTSATINNPFPIGTEFRIKAKAEKHVAIEFCQASAQTGPCGDNDYITIPANTQNNYMLSFVGIPLPPGDLVLQDGKANIEDLNKLKPLMGKSQSTLTQNDLLIGDVNYVNYDNYINIFDVFLILKTVETRYDD